MFIHFTIYNISILHEKHKKFNMRTNVSLVLLGLKMQT